MKLYIVRHGETQWNKMQRWQGSVDIPLNDRGIEQASLVAERLKNNGIKKIYSSPLVRAASTAKKIQEQLNVELFYNDGLKEISVGEWEGLTTEEILEKYKDLFLKWETIPTEEIGLGIENYTQLQLRAFNTIKEICDKENDDIAIVSHGAWIRSLICKFLNIPLNNRMGFEILNTGITIVDYNKDNNVFKVITLNDANHI